MKFRSEQEILELSYPSLNEFPLLEMDGLFVQLDEHHTLLVQELAWLQKPTTNYLYSYAIIRQALVEATEKARTVWTNQIGSLKEDKHHSTVSQKKIEKEQLIFDEHLLHKSQQVEQLEQQKAALKEKYELLQDHLRQAENEQTHLAKENMELIKTLEQYQQGIYMLSKRLKNGEGPMDDDLKMIQSELAHTDLVQLKQSIETCLSDMEQEFIKERLPSYDQTEDPFMPCQLKDIQPVTQLVHSRKIDRQLLDLFNQGADRNSCRAQKPQLRNSINQESTLSRSKTNHLSKMLSHHLDEVSMRSSLNHDEFNINRDWQQQFSQHAPFEKLSLIGNSLQLQDLHQMELTLNQRGSLLIQNTQRCSVSKILQTDRTRRTQLLVSPLLLRNRFVLKTEGALPVLTEARAPSTPSEQQISSIQCSHINSYILSMLLGGLLALIGRRVISLL